MMTLLPVNNQIFLIEQVSLGRNWKVFAVRKKKFFLNDLLEVLLYPVKTFIKYNVYVVNNDKKNLALINYAE